MVPGLIPGGDVRLRGRVEGSCVQEQEAWVEGLGRGGGSSWYLILESEMSNSRCMRCRSVPWFSFRLVVTTARNGFLASKGLGGESSAVSQASGLNLRTHKDPPDHTEHGNLKAGLLGQEETSPMRYRAFLAPAKVVLPAPPRGQSWVVSVPVYRHRHGLV